jgi:hypothetical protein
VVIDASSLNVQASHRPALKAIAGSLRVGSASNVVRL